MFLYIGIALLLILAILAVVVATRPGSFRLTRSATLAAPAPALFAQVNDFHKWRAWSPWEHLDPELRRSYEGPNEGVGAQYAWAGNKKAGEGRMTILESRPSESIVLKLEFMKPFKAVNKTEFAFRPEGAKTSATWTMTGDLNFMSKAFHMMIDMDKIVGADFEKGLAGLEKAAQAAGGQ